MAYDSESALVILFGGRTSELVLAKDTWGYDVSLGQWMQIDSESGTGPPALSGGAMVYDSESDRNARAEAVDEISRRLKRLVVEEQGELLDGIRREGADAVRTVLDDDAAAYLGVVVEPLQALAVAVGGDEKSIDSDEAESSVRSRPPGNPSPACVMASKS